nr:serine/threonine-protein kinase CTR1 [Tanacetum cinerariifolium]
MPHRTTYVFPRKFPESGVATNTSSKSEDTSKQFSSFMINDDDRVTNTDVYGVLQERTQSTKKKQQLTAFVNWLVEKKTHESPVTSNTEELNQLLPVAKDIVHDEWRDYHHPISRNTSLQRLSSDAGSSYAASLFSGTVATSSSAVFCMDSLMEEDVVIGHANDQEQHCSKDDDKGRCCRDRVRKWRDGYYLQLTLAKRLTRQATIGDEPTLIQGRGYGGGGASVVTCYDAEAVSYRLWICLWCLTVILCYTLESCNG